MSTNPMIAAPFVPVTTHTIDRANRLMSLRAHPGFPDLIALSQEMVQSSADICADFAGWDAQQIVVLKVRMQAAKEHHQLLQAKVQQVIQDGIDEMRAQVSSMPAKSAEDAVDQGDFVRQKVLENFEEQDGRLPGSY